MAEIPKNQEEWEKLIRETNLIIESPEQKTTRIYARLLEMDKAITNYDLICFCIMMLPTLLADLMPKDSTLSKIIASLIVRLRYMHYYHKMYEQNMEAKNELQP